MGHMAGRASDAADPENTRRYVLLGGIVVAAALVVVIVMVALIWSRRSANSAADGPTPGMVGRQKRPPLQLSMHRVRRQWYGS